MIRALRVMVFVSPSGNDGEGIASYAAFVDEDGKPVETHEPTPFQVASALKKALDSVLNGSCLPQEARPRVQTIRPQ